MQFVIDHAWLIPLLPILGAIVAGFFGDLLLKGRAHWPIWIGVGCSCVLSLIVLFSMLWGSDPNRFTPVSQPVYDWIVAGGASHALTDRYLLNVPIQFYFDPLTALMLTVVTGVGLIITIYSAGYMKGEEGYSRFFAYLGLFIFSMTCLVMANNLVLMFLGWEGVGLCSYLLIGYYYQRPAAAAAAKKAFIVNRIGDFGFIVGILLCFWAFNTTTLIDSAGSGKGILELAKAAFLHPPSSYLQMDSQTAFHFAQRSFAMKYIPFFLMLGAFGKSAQFPLYVWLPDAMEGPTPVSALIHAATMVTAGVYMIARCGTLFVTNTAALETIAAVGAFTALFAATIALRQFDLKKVFAYSTVSQLGYMFVGVGILAPTAAVFHLLTHAFFKALLFLSSGVVMHAMLGHLDMRKMSGLKHVLPKTNIVILIGCLALAGFPFTSGFFSKDEIVGQALDHSVLLWGVLLFTAFLTSYYTFRLYFQVFQGPLVQPTEPADADPGASPGHHAAVDAGAAHADDHGHAHNHEPWIMLVPLILLAIGALGIGWIFVRGSQLENFLGQSPSFHMAYDMAKVKFDNAGGVKVSPALFGQGKAEGEALIPSSMLIGGLVSVLGITLAYMLHLKDRRAAERLAAGVQPLTNLLEGKYWIDEAYNLCVVEPLRHIGKMFYAIDRAVVDGLVWAIGFVPQLSGFAVKLTLQRGYLQGYAATMLFGVLAILLLIFM
jgi:NADH-quinone oxidoreductase subunit L